jgi:hypothetical protein
MRTDRAAAVWLLVAALPLLVPLSTIPFGMVNEWGCGDFEPVGQEEHIERFRTVAVPLIALALVAVIGAIVFLTVWGRPASKPPRFGFQLVCAGLLTLVLATPFRGYLLLGGALAALLPLVTAGMAVVLALFLSAFRKTISTQVGRFNAALAARSIAWLVGIVLLGMLLFASTWDGGPLYC